MFTMKHRITAYLLALLLPLTAALAQQPYAGGTYTQDFNTLPSSNTFTFTGIGPFALDAAPVAASGMGGWTLAKYAGSGANAIFLVGTGSANNGAAYSFGAASASDRALGTVSSGSVSSRFGLSLVNNTGATITSFTLNYAGEQWRRGGSGNANTLTFAYAIGAADINAAGFTTVAALNFVSPSTVNTTSALDGNAAANRTAISSTVAGIAWGAGQTLTLRWTDVDDGGSDDGLALDDLSLSTSGGPTTPALISSVPANGSVNIAPNALINVTFNVPVTTSDAAFTISGSTSGAHTATLSGGPTTYTLSPTTIFDEAETVTVTALASGIADAATGTTSPASDATFSFITLSSLPLPINTVQGGGTASAYVGQVVAVEGVVTASFQGTNGLGGFYMQTPAGSEDANAATSEGIFVFTTSFSVSPGELVRVAGTVAEFGTAPATQTEITSVISVTHLGGAVTPAPVAVNLPFAAVDTAERYEGMLVTLPQTLTVNDNFDLGRFGEFTLGLGRLPTPTNVVAPGAPAIAQEVTNFLSQILVDDGLAPQNPDPTPFLEDSAGRGVTRRAGSTVTNLTGILDNKFSLYVIEPTAPVAFVDANPRSDAPAIGGTLRIVGGNVLNLFNGDGAGTAFPTARGADTFAEYQRQLAKVTAGIIAAAPDIMGLTEVENDGFGPTSALAQLIDALNAAAPAGTTYAFVDASGVDNGTDLIHVAFIYRTQTVALAGAPAALTNGYYSGIARPPLAQTFREIASGQILTVCINHFRAKGSVASSAAATDGISPNPNLDTGDGQGTNNYVRKREAETLVTWLATDPTGSGDPDFLIIGDLNAYSKEDPIAALQAGGYVNLMELFEGAGGYSYAFNGEFGHLDHALASVHLANQTVGGGTWHANADEPTVVDYNLEFKSAAQQAINTGTPFRYSDHDPVIIGVTLTPDPVGPLFTLQPVSQTATVGDTVTFTVAASGYPAPTFAWKLNGTTIPNETAPTLTLTNITSAQAGDYAAEASNFVATAISDTATLTVNKAAATVSLGDLTQTHDGAPKSVTVTTTPANLPVAVTYDGSSTPPGAPGAYAVIATIDSPDYTGSATGTLTIVDTTAPVFTSLTASPGVITKVNNKLVPVTLAANVLDAGDPSPTTRIVSVTSNDSHGKHGEKNHNPDWVFTGDLTLLVRAESADKNKTRIYTITVESIDDSGNRSTATATVTITKEKKHGHDDDDDRDHDHDDRGHGRD